jgi:hypothetical protein
MQTVTLQPYNPSATILRCRPARVYAQGRRRYDLQVRTWTVEKAPRFGTVRLVAQSPFSAVATERIEQLRRLPSIGTKVVVRSPVGFGCGEFCGVVARHVAEVGDEGETLIAEVEHQLASALNHHLTGRWQMDNDQPVYVEDPRVSFNASDRMLCSPSRQQNGNGSAHVFDDSEDAVRWTVAAALNYLLTTELPSYIRRPGYSELTRLAGNIDLGRYNAAGKELSEALVGIAHRGGLEISAARRGVGLIIYQPGSAGRRTSVCLQPTGENLNLARSNLLGGSISFDRRPGRRTIHILGAPKRHEATFDLQAGWDGDDETTRWRDFVRSESDDWPKRKNVYRRWVLNESGLGEGDSFDFATICSEDFKTNRSRRLLPCISTDDEGNSCGIVVEVRLASYDEWRRWSGPAWVSDEECAIVLGGDALPGDFFSALVDGLAEVRVTASVESDVRLEARVEGDPGCAVELHDVSDDGQWWAVHPTSIFFDGEADSTAIVRDDSARLEQLAGGRRAMAGRETIAKIFLAWIDTSCHVGDIVGRVGGRNVSLSSRPGVRPSVASVRHEFGETQQTHLVLEG